jgi:hypothetical protein
MTDYTIDGLDRKRPTSSSRRTTTTGTVSAAH